MCHTDESAFLHEISNPLTVMAGMLEGANLLSQAGKQEEADERALRSLEYLQKVIDMVNQRRELIAAQSLTSFDA